MKKKLIIAISVIALIILGITVFFLLSNGEEDKPTVTPTIITTTPEPTVTPTPIPTETPTPTPTPIPTATPKPTSTPKPTEAPKEKEVSIVQVGNEIFVWVDRERYTFTDINKKMYAIDAVDVRQGPDMECEIVGKLELGEDVYVIGKCNEADWYLISRMGEMQSVETKYLSDISPIATPTPTPEPTSTPKPTTKPSSGLSAKAEARKESILSKMESNPKVSHAIQYIKGYTSEGYPILSDENDPAGSLIYIGDNGKSACNKNGDAIFGLKYFEGTDSEGNLIVEGDPWRFATFEEGPSPDGGAQIGDPSKGNATIH